MFALRQINPNISCVFMHPKNAASRFIDMLINILNQSHSISHQFMSLCNCVDAMKYQFTLNTWWK